MNFKMMKKGGDDMLKNCEKWENENCEYWNDENFKKSYEKCEKCEKCENAVCDETCNNFAWLIQNFSRCSEMIRKKRNRKKCKECKRQICDTQCEAFSQRCSDLGYFKCILDRVPGATYYGDVQSDYLNSGPCGGGTYWGKGVLWSDGTVHGQLLEITKPWIYVKEYRPGYYKVSLMINQAAGGGHRRELPDDVPDDIAEYLLESGQYEEQEKGRFASNLRRARLAVEEYALCNGFRYFATFTINRERLDRTDLENFRRRFMHMIRNFRLRKGADIEFLAVPELHQDGNCWHIHALMTLPQELLKEYDKKNRRLPKKIRDMLDAGKRVFWWPEMQKNYGWNTLVQIEGGDRGREKLARYLVKYLRKSNYKTLLKLEKGQHLYYVSRGLHRARAIKNPEEVAALLPGLEIDFERGYETCIVRWCRGPSQSREIKDE